jgi:hypothetical protein
MQKENLKLLEQEQNYLGNNKLGNQQNWKN